ncbi:MAG: class A beta-lactamase BlaA [Gammaproteobacteria bacterium]
MTTTNFFHKTLLILMVFISIFINLVIPTFADSSSKQTDLLTKQLAALETSAQGHLGVFAIDTSTNTYFQYQAQQRFPVGSTAKVMAVAAILKTSMEQKNLLNQTIHYTKNDLVTYSPITQKHVATGMTLAELCKAAITLSDNSAMNLIMKKLGGPAAVTKFARTIDDTQFRLDRWETALNSAIPGDARDTSTPAAMAQSLKKLALGNILAQSTRDLLQTWLKNNTTGNERIRAGVPKNWVVGDKTGTSSYGTTNDIGIIWPPHCSPLVVAIYFTQANKEATPRSDVIAKATNIVMHEIASTNKCIKHNLA